MFGLAPSIREEGAKDPQKGQRAPQPSAGIRRRGADCPELLVMNNIPQLFLLVCLFAHILLIGLFIFFSNAHLISEAKTVTFFIRDEFLKCCLWIHNTL